MSSTEQVGRRLLRAQRGGWQSALLRARHGSPSPPNCRSPGPPQGPMGTRRAPPLPTEDPGQQRGQDVGPPTCALNGPAPVSYEVPFRSSLRTSAQPWRKQSGAAAGPAPETRGLPSCPLGAAPGQPGRLTSLSPGPVPILAIHCQPVESLPKNNRCFTFYA